MQGKHVNALETEEIMKIGKISESVLKRSVLRQIRTKRNEIVNGAGIGEDCAIFALSEKEFMASCVQEGAVAVQTDAKCAEKNHGVPCTTMGKLVQKCANNLAVGGAAPIAVMVSLLLPENIEEPAIKRLMAEAENACHDLSMQIAGGQTRVTPAVNIPYAVVTGYGKVEKNQYHTVKTAKPGQDIVISKWIGLEGTAYLAKENKEALCKRYPAYFVEEAAGFDRFLSVLPEAQAAIKNNVCAMHDASEGGIFGTLWELAEGAGVGMTVDLKKIPLRQETVEVCECLGCNPYELLSGGCLAMTSEDGPALVTALEAEGIPAVVVGRTTDSNDRIIMNEDEVRYMERPKQDEIYKS
uniref:AIR synthase family protein n=1 Tax=Acetatifactor sp. TaxID=1872090 RepID=UPI0040576458